MAKVYNWDNPAELDDWDVVISNGSGTAVVTGGELVLTPQQNTINGVNILSKKDGYAELEVEFYLTNGSELRYFDIGIGNGAILDDKRTNGSDVWHQFIDNGWTFTTQTMGSGTGAYLSKIVNGVREGDDAKASLDFPSAMGTAYFKIKLTLSDDGARLYYNDSLIHFEADTEFTSGKLFIHQGEYSTGAGAIAHLDKVTGTLKATVLDAHHPDLVAMYTMDAINGTTLVDETGNYPGTITGATQVTGIKGKALSFDGSSTNVVVVNNPELNDLSSLAISVWIKPLSLPGVWAGIASNFRNNTDVGIGYHVSLNSNNEIAYQINTTGVSSKLSNVTLPPAQLDKYTHIVLNWDGSTAVLYIDGVKLVGSADSCTGVTAVNARGLRIGSSNNVTANEFFHGDIDQLRIFNRALTADEIATLYAEPITSPTHPNLVAMYTMDNISGSVLTDETGNHNGTITGAVQVAGHLGKALSFDGVDDHVSISPRLPVGTQFAVSIWANLADPSRTDGDWIINSRSDTSAGTDWQLITYQGSLIFQLWDTVGNDFSASVAVPANNETSFIVGVKTATTVDLYVSGELVASAPMTTTPRTGSSHTRIGQRGWNDPGTTGDAGRMSGWIDQLRIFNRALTPAEITALYLEQLGDFTGDFTVLSESDFLALGWDIQTPGASSFTFTEGQGVVSDGTGPVYVKTYGARVGETVVVTDTGDTSKEHLRITLYADHLDWSTPTDSGTETVTVPFAVIYTTPNGEIMVGYDETPLVWSRHFPFDNEASTAYLELPSGQTAASILMGEAVAYDEYLWAYTDTNTHFNRLIKYSDNPGTGIVGWDDPVEVFWRGRGPFNFIKTHSTLAPINRNGPFTPGRNPSLGKIDALVTLQGSPVAKPVFILNQAGVLIAKTTSDQAGRYVVEGLEKNERYIVFALDTPDREFNGAISDFVQPE